MRPPPAVGFFSLSAPAPAGGTAMRSDSGGRRTNRCESRWVRLFAGTQDKPPPPRGRPGGPGGPRGGSYRETRGDLLPAPRARDRRVVLELRAADLPGLHDDDVRGHA